MANFIGQGTYTYANGGCCYRCGKNQDLIDTDCVIPGEGALALCAPCVTDFAEAASLTFNQARVAELETQLSEAIKARDVAQKIESRLQGVISRIQKVGSGG